MAPVFQRTRTLIWRLVAIVALVVGLVALVIPAMPTTPFLILAAWAAGKGWPSLERWLLTHPAYGPHIRNWRERGAVPRLAKMIAVGMMALSAVALQFTPLPAWARFFLVAVMVAVGAWLWRRPDA